MSFNFATCDRNRALGFLQDIYPSQTITDTPESAGQLLDYVEKDIVRIQDPLMHKTNGTIQVIPATNWNESHRDGVVSACMLFHS